MSSPISGSSFVFQDVYIQSVGTTAGIVEHQGPLGHYFDKHYPNHYHHHASYEQAEIEKKDLLEELYPHISKFIFGGFRMAYIVHVVRLDLL